MSSARRSTGAPSAGRPPVVVTFDEHGDLIDVVGDFDWFVAGDDTREQVLQRLHDLRQSHEADGPELIPAVELSQGRYADVHVLAEDGGYHFVILDTTALMQLLRRSQQAGNQAALLDGQRRRAVQKQQRPAGLRPRGLQQFRRSSDLFAGLINDTRAPLMQLMGHAHLLARRFNDDPAALRSIAAIQHAAVRLEALSANGLVGLGEWVPSEEGLDVVDLTQLAALLQDTFALQARGQGVGFEVQLPARSTLIELDSQILRQILINLIIHALDGMECGQLVISFSVGSQGLEIEIGCEPSGFSAEHFGALFTTDDMLLSNIGGSLGLAVSQQLMQQMGAALELVPRRAGGYELWVCVPLQRVAGAEGQLQVIERPIPSALLSGEQVAVVAVEPVSAAVSTVELLVDLGVPVVAVQETERIAALMRQGALGALIVSSPFDGRESGPLLKHLALPAEARVLLLTEATEVSGKMGWLRDRNCVQVAADADRDTLYAALRTILAG